MEGKTAYMDKPALDREKPYNSLESFDHNGEIDEDKQLNRMIKETDALLQEYIENKEEDNIKITRKVLERFINQKTNFHSN